MIRYSPIIFLLSCQGSGSFGIDKGTSGTDTAGASDTDTDTDADTDTDTDTDTDVDTDTDITIGTADTGPAGPPPPIPPDWLVDCNGGGDFLTIQDAIDGAVSGDRIGLNPCTYLERIDFEGKALEIYGIDGPALTIIDGSMNGTVVNIENGEGLGTRIAGVTITGGDDDDDGSAIEVHEAHLELDDVILTGNGESNAVLYLNIAWVDLNNVQIFGNDVMDEGSAIWSDSGSLTIDNSDINCDNGANGIWHHNMLLLSDSIVQCASGYGMHDYHGEDSIRRSTVYGGLAGVYAYDKADLVDEPDSPTERMIIRNSHIIGGDIGADVRYMTGSFINSIFDGGDIGLYLLENDDSTWGTGNVYLNADCGVDSDLPFVSSYSAFWNNTTDACNSPVNAAVTTDPLFVAYPFDASVQVGSPLIDAGPPGVNFNDVDGTTNDIGIFGGGIPHF